MNCEGVSVLSQLLVASGVLWLVNGILPASSPPLSSVYVGFCVQNSPFDNDAGLGPIIAVSF